MPLPQRRGREASSYKEHEIRVHELIPGFYELSRGVYELTPIIKKPKSTFGQRIVLQKIVTMNSTTSTPIIKVLLTFCCALAFYGASAQINLPDPNYISPITNRPLDKTKPSVTLAGEVNIANGIANYTLPINVPVGIQGVQPNLAISYNSNGGNGQLGLGWALAGTSSFSRGGSSHFLDGQVAPVTLTDDDNLFLDGQRLISYQTGGFNHGAQYRTLTKSYQKIKFIDNFTQH
jgi:hypothetical protein